MKTYVKPEIRYENFALSESIAQACDATGGNWIVRGAQTLESCYAESEIFPGIKLYASDTSCSQVESEEFCITQSNDLQPLMYSSY